MTYVPDVLREAGRNLDDVLTGEIRFFQALSRYYEDYLSAEGPPTVPRLPYSLKSSEANGVTPFTACPTKNLYQKLTLYQMKMSDISGAITALSHMHAVHI